MVDIRHCRRALALALLLGVAACGDDASRIASHLERGDEYLKESKFNEAVLEYRNVLQLDPNHAAGHYGLARAYLGGKQAQKAYWELQETVRLDPSNLDAKLEYAQFLLLGKKEELEEAVKRSDEVLAEAPDRIAAYLLKGRALQSLERYDEARIAYEEAMRKAPEDPGPVLLLATLERERGDTKRSEELFRKLVEVKPGFPAYAALAGFLASDRTRDEETERLYTTALEKAEEQERVPAYVTLANFYYSRERFADSEAVLEKGIEAVPEPADADLIYTLARFYHSRGDRLKAASTIQRAATGAVDDPKPSLVLSAYRGRIGDLDGALAAAEAALKAAPNDLTARLRKAELLVDLGYRQQDQARIDAGKAIVAEVLSGEVGQPEALFVQAKVDLAEKKPAEAATALRRALEQRPDWPQAHFLLGSALLLNRDLPGARASLSRALELDAAMLEASRLLARVHAQLGDDELALEVGRKALQRGEDRQLRVIMAQSLARQRKFEDAATQLEAIPESERDAEAWYALGRVNLLRGNPPGARPCFEKAQVLDPTRYEVLRALLDLDVKDGRLAESAQRVAAALRARPDDPRLVQLQGETALYNGDNATAEASFQRAIELDPNDLSAYEKLARYLMVTGRPDEVVRTYEAALKKNPDTGSLHLMVGSLYELQGKVPEAMQRYEDAVRLDPTLAVAKNNLAYLLADTGGNLDRALDLAQEARGLLPDNPNAADTLGWVLYKKNSPDAAVVHLREAVRSMEPDDPQLPIVRHHLGLAYEAAGDFESAREVVEQALDEVGARRKRAEAAGQPAADPPWVAELQALRERLQAKRNADPGAEG
jgi:tetratricopeptide (TPR) repeat protein